MEGILPLNKPAGLTSHDCVFKLRKILKTKKIGHTGTLDPDVTGVLPICIGKATKVAEYIMEGGKAYEGEVTLGIATTTEDASGEVIAKKTVNRVLTRAEILNVFSSLTGEIEQTPPLYSAVKVNGKRLYEYARQGIEIERPTRKVKIYELKLLDDREEFSGATITFRFQADCSKGTYIRTLAVMIGERLGYPAHMSKLQRIRSSSFHLEDCFTLAQIEEMAEQGTIEEALYPIETALSNLPKYRISDKVAEKVINGAVLPLPDELTTIGGPFTVENQSGLVLAIYAKHPEKPGLIKPVKVLRNESEAIYRKGVDHKWK